MTRKTALVTGGAIRVGKAIAFSLAEQGYDIALHYNHSSQAAVQTAEELKKYGVEVKLYQANLIDPEHCHELINRVFADNHLSVLVNSAAIFPEADSIMESLGDWDSIMGLNLRAPLLLSQAFVEHAPVSAHIINILDARINHPAGDHMVYRLSKSGLWHMTESLARELAPNVQVNGLALGAIMPPPGASQDHFERMAEHIPLARTGSPKAIGDAVKFLVGQDFITGTVLPIDGGEFL
ncbi:SDR family oxidoreductase [Kangiella sediminilitoris]|uniref:Short-chain dehydrogenase/reductase SDR n=1 Tax=Kangiella sediminilitoris TaxID=1144748 RepID=A0A1B3B8Q2_9GAMM|nr:SDR family oxidoreductase [Kangiella sediminilitoris]AOE49151.1 Short-chain dehydrogenase/reductase SDR [Kangiella sediminilitoris]